MLADLTGEHVTLAEMEDLESLNDWICEVNAQVPL
jgi:hypothetical protein